MKKALKYSLLLVLGVLLLGILILGINFLPLFSMSPVETGKIPDTDLYAIRNNRNNLFAFEAGDGYVLIDAGSNAAAVKETLAQIPIDAASVKYVLLTHGFGSCGGLGPVPQRGNMHKQR